MKGECVKDKAKRSWADYKMSISPNPPTVEEKLPVLESSLPDESKAGLEDLVDLETPNLEIPQRAPELDDERFEARVAETIQNLYQQYGQFISGEASLHIQREVADSVFEELSSLTLAQLDFTGFTVEEVEKEVEGIRSENQEMITSLTDLIVTQHGRCQVEEIGGLWLTLIQDTLLGLILARFGIQRLDEAESDQTSEISSLEPLEWSDEESEDEMELMHLIERWGSSPEGTSYSAPEPMVIDEEEVPTPELSMEDATTTPIGPAVPIIHTEEGDRPDLEYVSPSELEQKKILH